VSGGTNRNLPSRDTLVQLLALYSDLESHKHSITEYRQTDRQTDTDRQKDGQTDDMMMPIAYHTLYQ